MQCLSYIAILFLEAGNKFANSFPAFKESKHTDRKI